MANFNLERAFVWTKSRVHHLPADQSTTTHSMSAMESAVQAQLLVGGAAQWHDKQWYNGTITQKLLPFENSSEEIGQSTVVYLMSRHCTTISLCNIAGGL